MRLHSKTPRRAREATAGVTQPQEEARPDYRSLDSEALSSFVFLPLLIFQFNSIAVGNCTEVTPRCQILLSFSHYFSMVLDAINVGLEFEKSEHYLPRFEGTVNVRFVCTI
jgi:hypothetical protein